MIKNGHNFRMYIDTVATAKATNCSMDLSAGEIATAHKDTAGDGTGWDEFASGAKSGTVSSEGLYEETDSGIDALFDAFAAGTIVAWKFSDEVTANRYYFGNGIITAFTKNAPNNENVTYSITVRISGAVSRGVVPI